METRTERTNADAMRNAGWAAVALAAGGSLLHWITTSTDTHSWTADAGLSLVAGAGLMTLAIGLSAGPWPPRRTGWVAIVGAAYTTVVALAFVLLVLLEPAVPPLDSGHAGHGAGGAGLSSAEVVRTTIELGLVGVLVWLHRLSGRHGPEISPAAG